MGDLILSKLVTSEHANATDKLRSLGECAVSPSEDGHLGQGGGDGNFPGQRLMRIFVTT